MGAKPGALSYMARLNAGAGPDLMSRVRPTNLSNSQRPHRRDR
jgi:hypothetical protein